jgi:hypothetical protein
MTVYEMLKKGECNQSVLLQKLRNSGVIISEKTLRKYLEHNLKNFVGEKNISADSTSRHLKNARVFFAK